MKLMKSLLALAALFCAVTFVSAADECADKVKCAVKDAKCAVEKHGGNVREIVTRRRAERKY